MRKILPVSLIILLAASSSCTTEYKLAREFRNDMPGFYLHLSPPSLLFKYNHKGEVVEGFDRMNPQEQDSALFYSSKFIRFINDSTFLERYVNSFLDELRNLNFTVYIGNEADSFLLSQPQSYALSMAQMQLDEYFYPHEDQEYFYDTLFYKKIDLSAVDFSVWFELSKIGRSGRSKTVLYASHMVTDDLEGEFLLDPFRQDVKYSYRIDSLEVNDLYDIASFLGKVHASFLYDFFLNQYIAFHYPQGFRPQVYYHYNRFHNSFVPVEEERFELLDGY
ncbi:MAG: hypothetical protein D4R67_00885 [Bacteroidetes bacterium]|nr:MAG: hypothetical protein D4R67_00885 [Bacteroidota bacterium]